METIAQTSQIISVESIKHDFYQCQFGKVIEQAEMELSNQNDLSKVQQLIHLKAKAQFELNYREDAMETLSLGKNLFKIKENADTWYALGSLYYFQGYFKKALESFEKMLEFDLTPEKSYLALLSIGNVYYSQKNWDSALAQASELSKYSESVPTEYGLSLDLLNANILVGMGSNMKLAQETYEGIYTTGVEKQWNFFALRSLYYLAKSYMKMKEFRMAEGVLKVLNLNLKVLDWRFLAMLVNQEFDAIQFTATQKVSINAATSMVTIGNKDQYDISLERWPQLFKLAELLYISKDFVSKVRIAEVLWPDQKYLSKTHDPRIYDLIARLKKKLEVSQDVSLLIVAGNGGYKMSV